MSVDVVEKPALVLAGAFLARTTYGGEYIDPAFNLGGDDDAEKADDYRGYLASQSGGSWQLLDDTDLRAFDDRDGDAEFTSGGLFNARVDAGSSNTFDAQALLAVEGGDTLVLAFRGTDGKDPAVEDGQAFTGEAVAANYKAFKPLIDAAFRYLQDHPEITEFVVAGHSLGGAMADVFTLKDADRFRAIRPDGLTIVSLASSGVPKDLPEYLAGIDAEAATVVERVILETPFGNITVDEIARLHRPADYISISNGEDRAHFPNDFPDFPEDNGLVPIVLLKDNLQFGGDLVFDVPNIDNSDVRYYEPADHPFDFRGMGAQHSSALLWANLQGLLSDNLLNYYSAQNLIAGITDYNAVPDFDGSAVALFEGYIKLDNPDIMNDRGARTLTGTSKADFILGLAGHDRLAGREGSDLLSGGSGEDLLQGGAGVDKLSGGLGRDELQGGADADRFVFGDTAESVPGGQRDVILDFRQAQGDRIVLTGIDAASSIDGNQAFTFIGGAAFTAEGQIRAAQLGADTILRFNTAGSGGNDMEILLKNVAATTLTGADFIL